ncbi:hypothetical protein ACFSC3_16050 [Sphingomonas floccifaciens]|uniref:Uncharacterized protein n=1 Tax=Sphingomonas floccifaciens TaxID=1844115 RepID=A0ABW4NG47_9SPHN
MFKLLSLIATPALALVATAGIAGEPTKSFTHDGVTYRYASTKSADGATILTGTALPTGEAFRLVIRDGNVTGHAGTRPVRFTVASAKVALARGTADRVANAD